MRLARGGKKIDENKKGQNNGKYKTRLEAGDTYPLTVAVVGESLPGPQGRKDPRGWVQEMVERGRVTTVLARGSNE